MKCNRTEPMILSCSVHTMHSFPVLFSIFLAVSIIYHICINYRTNRDRSTYEDIEIKVFILLLHNAFHPIQRLVTLC